MARVNHLTVLVIAVGLAMDAFAVALAVGAHLGRVGRRQYFRLAWHFGLFQFGMPILGWAIGHAARDALSAVDHWVSFAILLYVGAGMLKESISGRHAALEMRDPTRGASLVILSLATSVDALAVGVSLAFLESSIVSASVVIGIVAALLTLLGLAIGTGAGRALGRVAEAAGGILLIGIGVRVLVSHLWV